MITLPKTTNKTIAIAISGGSDSMALALLLKENKQKILALTVDHGLRAESAAEAKQVGKWLEKYGIEHHTLKWEGRKKSSNIQANAREARYKLMAEFCKSHNIDTLAVAHTMDDQAETVLMRIFRGSGVDGLAGIPQQNEMFGIRIIRPLLQTTRENLRNYLRKNKQKWIEDPSNHNEKFTRVQVRKLLGSLPDSGLITARLADTAAHMARTKDYIETRLEERLHGIIKLHDFGFYILDAVKFRKLHEEERLRALAAMLQQVSGNPYRPRFDELSALHDKIISGKIGNGCTLWGCEISSSKKKGHENILYLYREPAAVSPDVKLKPGEMTVWDGRFECVLGKRNLELRTKNLGSNILNTNPKMCLYPEVSFGHPLPLEGGGMRVGVGFVQVAEATNQKQESKFNTILGSDIYDSESCFNHTPTRIPPPSRGRGRPNQIQQINYSASDNFETLTIGALGKKSFDLLYKTNPKLKSACKDVPKKVIYTLPALKNLEKVLSIPHIGI